MLVPAFLLLVFRQQVRDARSRLDDAMRVQAAAVPEGLTDHLVIMGAHPRLQYYVVAMRRQRPDVEIVVVTSDKVVIFHLSGFIFAYGDVLLLLDVGSFLAEKVYLPGRGELVNVDVELE